VKPVKLSDEIDVSTELPLGTCSAFRPTSVLYKERERPWKIQAADRLKENGV
jgi:hypothetical protein